MLASAYVLVVAIIALLVPLALSLSRRVDGEVRSQASSEAALLAASIGEGVDRSSAASLDALAAITAQRVHGRVVVVDARGRLLADSAGVAERGQAFGTRPEVRAALAGRVFQGVRHSETLGTDLLVTASPIPRAGGGTAGAVRITQRVDAVHRAVRTTVLELVLVAGVVLAFGLAAGALLARRISGPLLRLERTAHEVAGGDLHARALEEGSVEQRSLARSFNQMTDRLTALLGAQRRFVADASHQLRTPLTGLRLRLEALSAAQPHDAAARDLDAAVAEVDRLAAIVEGLLALSRSAERARPGQACDLAVAADDAARRFRSRAAAQRTRLRVAHGDPPPSGWCDPRDLARALDQLVENALVYGGRGGEVELAVAPGVIEVRDRGPGPRAGEEEDVFERFHRGSAATRDASGTGLGLAIARAHARSWGGEATLRARQGGGAIAALVIPAPRAEPALDEAATPDAEVPA